jgi:uncharacterized membrane protein
VSRRPLRLVALCLAALSFGAPLQAAPPRGGLVTGFVRFDGPQGAWTFQRCGARARTPLVDESPQMALSVSVGEVRQAMQTDARARGVYVEFLGHADDKQAVVRRFWRALGHVPSCAQRPANVPRDATLWASGHEPAWSFVATPRGAQFALLGGARLSFAAGALRRAGEGVYEAKSAGAALRIELVEAQCSDTMAEAGYGATAVVTVIRRGEAMTYRGCAARF